MMSHEEIFATLKGILVDIFEADESLVTPDTHLFDELDLDSIDAIDLVGKMQDFIGGRVQPDAFRHARTVSDVVDIIAGTAAD